MIFQVGVELPIDSDEADEENKTDDGRTLLNILHCGCILPALSIFSFLIQSLTPCCRRDAIGDSVVAGDLRWGGTYGVNVDFVARSHTSIAFIKIESVQVTFAVFLPKRWTWFILCNWFLISSFSSDSLVQSEWWHDIRVKLGTYWYPKDLSILSTALFLTQWRVTDDHIVLSSTKPLNLRTKRIFEIGQDLKHFGGRTFSKSLSSSPSSAESRGHLMFSGWTTRKQRKQAIHLPTRQRFELTLPMFPSALPISWPRCYYHS